MTAILYRLAQQLDDLAFRSETWARMMLRVRSDRVSELQAAVLRHDPRQRLAHANSHLWDFRARMDRSLERLIEASQSRLGALDARLNALSPLAVLDRGYALVLTEAGQVVRSAAQVEAGDRVTTRVADGAFVSRVDETHGNGMMEK